MASNTSNKKRNNGQVTDSERSLLGSELVEQQVSYDLYDQMSLQKMGVSEKDVHSFSKIIGSLRNNTSDREARFKQYEEALQDPIIGQAVEMLSDDATQFDVDRERTVWIESDDKEYADAVNELLHTYIEPFIDTVASEVTSKGEFLFKVGNINPNDTLSDSSYINIPLIPYRNVASVHHLVMPNQLHVYFITKSLSKLPSDYDKYFFDEWTFLHFMNNSLKNSLELDLLLPSDKIDVEKEKQQVFVLQGESILTDKVLEVYRILKALENGLILARLAKSKIVRFVKVNVSRLSDDAKAQALVNYIHGAIVTNERISTDTYESTEIQPEPVVVTIPVKDGVGDVTIDEFATSADIKEIADIDHFMSKLFAGLRTPRQYFNYDESLPGPLSAASLARTDIRYSRAVKKVQRVLVNGIKSLLKLFNHVNGILEEEAPKVIIRIVKVASAEDEERYIEMQERMNVADAVINSVYISPADTAGLDIKKCELYEKFFTDVVPIRSLSNYFADIRSKTNIKSKPKEVNIITKNEGSET